MNEIDEPTKRGRKPNLGGSETFSVTVAAPVAKYLAWLARHSMFGTSISEVASRFVSERAEDLFNAAYHDRRLPRDD